MSVPQPPPYGGARAWTFPGFWHHRDYLAAFIDQVALRDPVQGAQLGLLQRLNETADQLLTAVALTCIAVVALIVVTIFRF